MSRSLGAAIAGAPQATFKAGNRTVAVYATVTDRTGRLVPDLSRDDFIVEDEGRRQTLAVFDNQIQPITIVVLLDRSGSMEANFDLVRQAGEAFVAQLRPDDKARIGSFSNRHSAGPEGFHVQSGRARRPSCARSCQARGPTPLWNAVDVGITALLAEEGRRVILVFTDGSDFPFNFKTRNRSLKEVMKRADEENVMVYAIGLAGQRVPTPIKPPPTGRPGSRRPVAGVSPPDHAGRQARSGPRADRRARPAAATSSSRRRTTWPPPSRVWPKSCIINTSLGFTPDTLDGKTHHLTVRVIERCGRRAPSGREKRISRRVNSACREA